MSNEVKGQPENTKPSDSKNSVKPPAIKILLNVFKAIIAILIIYSGIYLFLMLQIIRYNGSKFDLTFTEKLNRMLEALQQYIFDFSSLILPNYELEFIFLTPFVVLLIESVTNLKINNKLLIKFFSIWAGLSFLYGFVYLFTSDIKIMSFIIISSPILMIAVLTNEGTAEIGKYFSNKVKIGIITRVVERKELKYSHAFVRQLFIAIVFSLFWFNETISFNCINDGYILFITSCLFVLGFLALIFTYAFEKIDTLKALHSVEDDTNIVYRIVGLTVMLSFAGMFLFAETNLTFDLNNPVGEVTFASAVFLVAFAGTAFSIDATISIFRVIAASLTLSFNNSSSQEILIDEIGLGSKNSFLSSGDTGWSEVGTYLIDRGYKLTPFHQATLSGLRRNQPKIIILHCLMSKLSDELLEFYIDIMSEGTKFIVFVDSVDLPIKQSFLNAVDIHSNDIISIGKQADLEMEIITKSTQSPYKIQTSFGVAFNNNTQLETLIKINENQKGFSAQSTFVGFKRHGKGGVYLVGDINPFRNCFLKHSKNNILAIDAVFDSIEEQENERNKVSKY